MAAGVRAAAAAAEQRRGEGGLFGFLGELIETIARPAPAARCFKREVEQAIEPLLGAGEVSIDRIARELGMSRQTLYRRLKAEGMTFEEILDAKRRQLAVRYLGAGPQLGEGGGVPTWFLRPGRVQPRVQALDRHQPERIPRGTGRLGGAPGRIRTCDPKLRRLVLYPTELRARARRISALSRPAERR